MSRLPSRDLLVLYGPLADIRFGLIEHLRPASSPPAIVLLTSLYRIPTSSPNADEPEAGRVWKNECGLQGTTTGRLRNTGMS